MVERVGQGAGIRNGDTTKYGNPLDFDVDLHSVYAAYIGLFESSAVDWWERSWGGYFHTFNDFLGVKWEVMVVVDIETGRAHVATRRDEITKFAKHIKTRFGESLPKDPPTTLPLSPVPTKSLALRRLSNIQDLASYRKLSQTLQAAELTYLRSRVRGGEVAVLEQLFYAGGAGSHKSAGVKDNGVGYTWACITTTWWEKGGPAYGTVPGQGLIQHKASVGKGLPLEVGMAVIRCANLRAVDVWPPVPDVNYRKSHFVTQEWVDKRTNTAPPSYPRAYGFGKSRYVDEKDVEKIVEATLGALATQENDSTANQLILISLGEPSPLPMSVSSTLPSNILQVDLFSLEFSLLLRAQANRIAGTPHRTTPLTSLSALLQTLQIPISSYAPLGNAGNEAFYAVLAFQKLMMADTQLPDLLFQQQSYPYQYPLPAQAFVASDSRRQSSSALLRPESYMAAPPRRASDNVRPRPSSLANSLSQRGSMPGMNRSQTVFWDDADYTDHENPGPSGTEAESARGRLPAPAFKSSTSSRSVSWDDSRDLPTPPRNQVPSNTSSPRRPGHPLASSSSSIRDAAKSSEAESPQNSKVETGTDKKNGKEPKPKLKSEKSVRDIAGALAKFWVG